MYSICRYITEAFMARVSIAKWGNSLAIRLPKHLADDLKIQDGTTVDLDVKKGLLVARPVRKRPRLADLVKKITPKNRHAATDWGDPVGNEVW
jgi:antitoxin MazE